MPVDALSFANSSRIDETFNRQKASDFRYHKVEVVETQSGKNGVTGITLRLQKDKSSPEKTYHIRGPAIGFNEKPEKRLAKLAILSLSVLASDLKPGQKLKIAPGAEHPLSIGNKAAEIKPEYQKTFQLYNPGSRSNKGTRKDSPVSLNQALKKLHDKMYPYPPNRQSSTVGGKKTTTRIPTPQNHTSDLTGTGNTHNRPAVTITRQEKKTSHESEEPYDDASKAYALGDPHGNITISQGNGATSHAATPPKSMPTASSSISTGGASKTKEANHQDEPDNSSLPPAEAFADWKSQLHDLKGLIARINTSEQRNQFLKIHHMLTNQRRDWKNIFSTRRFMRHNVPDNSWNKLTAKEKQWVDEARRYTGSLIKEIAQQHNLLTDRNPRS